MVEDWSEWIAWQLVLQLDALQQSLGVQIELLNLDPKDMVEDWSESVALLQLEWQLGTLQQSVGVQIDLLNLDPKRYGGGLEHGRADRAAEPDLDPKDMVEDWSAAVSRRADRAVEPGMDPKGMVENWRVSEGVSEWVAWQLERQLDALQQSLGVQIELLNLGWSGGLEGAC
ncbi:unnamed protein product [Closterium sp. NIES-64]|nr:unnamed protein product [Closterium sp. NIES-64]